jgi:hypothetical protein
LVIIGLDRSSCRLQDKQILMDRNRPELKFDETETDGPVRNGYSPVRSTIFFRSEDQTFKHYV